MTDARSIGYEGPSYFVGLDLGKQADFSCMVILERSSQLPDADYTVVYIMRWPLRTEYLDIVRAVAQRVSRPELRPPDRRPPEDALYDTLPRVPLAPKPMLIVDATGLGTAVVELVAKENLPVEFRPLTITGGAESTEVYWGDARGTMAFRTPKQELVGTMQAMLGTGRLKIPPHLDNAHLLKQELRDFRVHVTKAAHETYAAREGKHDDLVLATALPLWAAERPKNCGWWGPNPFTSAPRTPGPEEVIRGGGRPARQGGRGPSLR